MKYKFLMGFIAVMLNTSIFAQSLDPNILQYIDEYKWWAMQEQQRTGVPAAIKLAQGIHETGAGTSELAQKANNHFGIKCRGNQWTGDVYSYTDDLPNECFRAYKDPIESYMDHSDFLKNNQRYSSLFKLEKTDYHSWCNGLRKAGYATNPKYAQLLIHYIETYQLHEYTLQAEDAQYVSSGLIAKQGKEPVLMKNTVQGYMAKATQSIPENVTYYEITSRNGLKGFYAQKGDLLLEAAIKHRIRYNRLLQLNDLPDAILDSNMFIYLEPKHRVGIAESYHVAKENEQLIHISQEYGIQLRTLIRLNHISKDDVIVAGQKVFLKDENTQSVLVENKSLTEKDHQNMPTETSSTPKKIAYIPTQKTTIVTPEKEEKVTINRKEELKKEEVISDYGYPSEEIMSSQASVSSNEENLSPLDRLKAHMDQNVYPDRTTSPVNTVEPSLYETRPAGSTDKTQSQIVSNAPSSGLHKVQKGETAYGISKKYGITLKQLSDWNQLNGRMNIQVGQELKVKP